MMQCVISTCQVNNLQAMCTWQCETWHTFSNLNSQHDMQLFCSLHTVGGFVYFFYKKITKRPLLFIFFKKYKTFGPKWTKCWNPPESGTIFCFSSLFNHWSELKLFIHFGWTETDNYETCIKKQKLCSQFLLHL